MKRQQAGKRITNYLLTHLDMAVDATDVAIGAETTPGTASKYLRDFSMPGYTCTRTGNSFVISRIGGAPRAAKIQPPKAKPDPLAGFEKFMASEKTADKVRELLAAAYLAGSQG